MKTLIAKFSIAAFLLLVVAAAAGQAYAVDEILHPNPSFFHGN